MNLAGQADGEEEEGIGEEGDDNQEQESSGDASTFEGKALFLTFCVNCTSCKLLKCLCWLLLLMVVTYLL